MRQLGRLITWTEQPSLVKYQNLISLQNTLLAHSRTHQSTVPLRCLYASVGGALLSPVLALFRCFNLILFFLP